MTTCHFKQLFLFCYVSLCPLVAFPFNIDGIEYAAINDHEVAVTFYQVKYTRDVTIPEFVTLGDRKYKVTSIGRSAFSCCRSLTSVTIPSSVKSIGMGAFSGCSSLSSVSIPSSVTSIGRDAFSDCASLVNVSIPSSVTDIGDQAFSGCSNLASASIPNGVTCIGDRAFLKCSSLASVTIPSSVTSIGLAAFVGCEHLAEVWNCQATPLKIDNSIFDHTAYGNATLYVPAESVASYKSAEVWSWFNNIQTIDPTGIADIKSGQVTVRRLGSDGLIVTGAGNKPVSMYDTSGSVVSRGTTHVSGLAHGLYLVRVGKKTYKVSI